MVETDTVVKLADIQGAIAQIEDDLRRAGESPDMRKYFCDRAAGRVLAMQKLDLLTFEETMALIDRIAAAGRAT